MHYDEENGINYRSHWWGGVMVGGTRAFSSIIHSVLHILLVELCSFHYSALDQTFTVCIYCSFFNCCTN